MSVMLSFIEKKPFDFFSRMKTIVSFFSLSTDSGCLKARNFSASKWDRPLHRKKSSCQCRRDASINPQQVHYRRATCRRVRRRRVRTWLTSSPRRVHHTLCLPAPRGATGRSRSRRRRRYPKRRAKTRRAGRGTTKRSRRERNWRRISMLIISPVLIGRSRWLLVNFSIW